RGVGDHRAVGQPDQHVVLDRAAVGVEHLAGLEDDRVQSRLGARELHLVADAEGSAEAHRVVSVVRAAARAAARSSTLRPSSVGQRVYSVLTGRSTWAGTPMVAMPDATAEATPVGESSIATQSAGSSPSVFAACR